MQQAIRPAPEPAFRPGSGTLDRALGAARLAGAAGGER